MEREQGFYADSDILKQYGYILMCQLLAMESFEGLAYSPGYPDAVNNLREQREDSELNKNIMTLAALARANSDARNHLKIHIEKVGGVGSLTTSTKSKDLTTSTTSKDLTAREACNKIIHAKSGEIEFITTNEHPLYHQAYLSNKIPTKKEYRIPLMHLHGVYKSEAWNAELNMIKWIFAIVEFGAD